MTPSIATAATKVKPAPTTLTNPTVLELEALTLS